MEKCKLVGVVHQIWRVSILRFSPRTLWTRFLLLSKWEIRRRKRQREQERKRESSSHHVWRGVHLRGKNSRSATDPPRPHQPAHQQLQGCHQHLLLGSCLAAAEASYGSIQTHNQPSGHFDKEVVRVEARASWAVWVDHSGQNRWSWAQWFSCQPSWSKQKQTWPVRHMHLLMKRIFSNNIRGLFDALKTLH